VPLGLNGGKVKLVLRSLILATLVSAQVLAQRDGGGGGGPSATCRPVDDNVTYNLAALRSLVTSTDSVVVASRQAKGLPAVAPTQVTYVTDNSVCSKAEKTYTSAITGAAAVPSLQVYVFKVGNAYQVWDPVQRAGEFTIAMTLNNSFTFVAKYTL
jgi:hypothetical protein